MTSYPRSGTTVTHDIVWILVNDLDFERYSKLNSFERVPFFDRNSVHCKSKGSENLRKNGKDEEFIEKFYEEVQRSVNELENWKGRRVIKSHLPYELCPNNLFTSGCKVIYMTRNPKDQMVSYYHLQKLISMRPFIGSFEKYWDYVEQNLLFHSPYWEHVKQAWEKRNDKNFLFLFYEDLRKDLRGFIRNIANFLEKPLTEDQLDKMVEFFDFENFKKQTKNFSNSVGKKEELAKNNAFQRKGAVNGWQKYFTNDLNKRADKWIEDNISKIPGFKYPELVQL